MSLWPLCLALLAVNALAFLAFGHDKARARAGERRVPERDLLLLALVGGSVGALLGRRIFRHKTRKAGFSLILLGIAALQAMLLGILLFGGT